MPSFLENFLTPLKNTYTKAKEVAQPLFVNANEYIQNKLEPSEELKSLANQAKTYAEQNQQGIQTFKKIRDTILPAPKSREEALRSGLIPIGGKDNTIYMDPMFSGGLKNVGKQATQLVAKEALPVAKKVFGGFQDLTTKVLEKLKGRAEVSKQFISDLTNSPELKQTEKDVIRNVLDYYKDNSLITKKPTNIPVAEFAEKVKTELLPLKRVNSARINNNGSVAGWFNPGYEHISLPDELRGSVAEYSENIYRSPIKTSAGNIHFEKAGNSRNNYFGHTRVEDLATKGELRETSMVGNMQQEIKSLNGADADTRLEAAEGYLDYLKEHFTKSEIKQYKNLFKEGLADDDTAQEIFNKVLSGERKTQLESKGGIRRVIEVQSDLYQKGGLEREGMFRDEKGNLPQFTGKLADTPAGIRNAEVAKLEQYNDPTAHFRMVREEVKQAALDGKTKLQFPTGETAMKIEGLGGYNGLNEEGLMRWGVAETNEALIPERLKVGLEVFDDNTNWIITDVLGDGKFKAIQKDKLDPHFKTLNEQIEDAKNAGWSTEEFDISGKVDTNNPIYKFYEKDLGRYLKSKYNAKLITDPQGVQWYELDIKPEHRGPVEAFGVLPFLMPKKEESKK